MEPSATGVRTRRIALIVTFAVLSTALDSIVTPGFSAGVWFGWVFVVSPITGILLGPRDGFIATLISVMIGHSLVFRDTVYEYVFTLGAPICSMMSGYTSRGGLGKVSAYYSALLAAYFLTPVTWGLPIWGMWNVYLAYVIVVVVGVMSRLGRLNLEGEPRHLFALSALLGLEADVLFRIFVFVPLQAYKFFYGLTPEALALIWAVHAPLITPIKVAASTLITTMMVPSLMKVLRERQHLTVE